ncbi:MAG: flavodoxin domain-containing protein [Candidatus Bathyarchaeota archaeon]|nr:flavodoxin domain-containing protein [Candidatus Bathyarchaeota archaeon]
MSQNKTLVAYESKQGASREAAGIVADVLRGKFGLKVDVVDLKEQPTPDVKQYRGIVVGAGVRGGRIYGKAKALLENLAGKQVAFFTCSSWAGTPGSYENAKKQYIEKTVAKHPNVTFVGAEAFGGRIKYFRRLMLDNTDPAKVKAWAEQLGEVFSQ